MILLHKHAISSITQNETIFSKKNDPNKRNIFQNKITQGIFKPICMHPFEIYCY